MGSTAHTKRMPPTIRTEMYPWIGALVSGLVGLLVAMIASSCISYFPYSLEDMDWRVVFESSGTIGVLIAWIVVLYLSIEAGTDEGIGAGIGVGVIGFFIGIIGGYIIGGIIGLIIAPIAPIILGIVLGAAAGVIVGIAMGGIRNFDDIFGDGILLTPGVIIGIILSGVAWGLNNEFLINILFVPIATAVGYIVGKFFERKEEERLEYEKRMRKRKAKIEQWKMKYVVSDEKKLLENELKFEDYKKRIECLEKLEIELNSLDVKGFESEVLLIRQKLKDPNKIEMIESEISSLRRKIKGKIEILIHEAETIIKKAMHDAIKAKKSFWLSALEIFRADFLNFSQEFESGGIPLKAAVADALRLREEADALSIPPLEEGISKEERTKENHYDTLGVSSKASQDEIKSAYRKKTKEYHPDRISSWANIDKVPEWVNKEVDGMTKKLNEAYGVLKDPNKRREYDKKTGM